MKSEAIRITSMKRRKIGTSTKTIRMRTWFRDHPRRAVWGACVRANVCLDTDGWHARWSTANLSSCGIHWVEPAKNTLVRACHSL